MTYKIHEACTGCTLCAMRCPANCISGSKKELHVIDPDLCFDCGVCASYCPADCISDQLGNLITRLKLKERPVAFVDKDSCTGCEACVDICPFDCIEMVEDESTETMFPVSNVVRPKDCVACALCVTVCSDKEAIALQWPDGTRCASLTRGNFSDTANAGVVSGQRE